MATRPNRVLSPLNVGEFTQFSANSKAYSPVGEGKGRSDAGQLLNLTEFKVNACRVAHQHNHKHCPFYHSHKDKRRLSTYTPDLCPASDSNSCPRGDSCPKSHNRVEQLYHPDKYKTKFCTQFPDKLDACDYGTFCSFAHSEEEIKVTLIHHKERDAEFYMYQFKTVWCPFINAHDKALCVYAHNWQDCRRNPAAVDYQPIPCPNWRAGTFILSYEQGGCRDLMRCHRCHGWKEYEYHPLEYKTKLCSAGTSCTRVTDCPYYHGPRDRREGGIEVTPPPGFEQGIGEDKENVKSTSFSLHAIHPPCKPLPAPLPTSDDPDSLDLFQDIAAFVGQRPALSSDLSAFYTLPEPSKLAVTFPEQERIPERLVCPLTKRLMHDPVVFSEDGKTYEYRSIVTLIKEKFTDRSNALVKALKPDEATWREIAELTKEWV